MPEVSEGEIGRTRKAMWEPACWR